MPRVVVLGSKGMLGSEVTSVLMSDGFDVLATSRDPGSILNTVVFDFDRTYKYVEKFFENLKQVDFVINCIGLIKQKTPSATANIDFVALNSLLPIFLDRCAEKFNFKVIQIATDCVYSGDVGNYLESSTHDASDIYGATKSLGEIDSPNYLNLRCSIIGKEFRTSVSLYNWLLSQERSAQINGYTDHLWNGLTTRSFARIVSGTLSSKNFVSGTNHIVPADYLSKYELLKIIAKLNEREDLSIEEYESGTPVDRRLSTEYPQYNADLWSQAGYNTVPTIEEMIQEFI